MVCNARIKGKSCCSACLMMGAGRSRAKPLILRQEGLAEKGWSSGIYAASACTCCMCASRARACVCVCVCARARCTINEG